jgi:hypothetical protein
MAPTVGFVHHLSGRAFFAWTAVLTEVASQPTEELLHQLGVGLVQLVQRGA